MPLVLIPGRGRMLVYSCCASAPLSVGCESLAGNLADVLVLTWAESGKLRS